MCKKEILYVVLTLVVTAAAWLIYDNFVKEEKVDPGKAPEMSIGEVVEESDSSAVIEEAEVVMDLENIPSVGNEAE